MNNGSRESELGAGRVSRCEGAKAAPLAAVTNLNSCNSCGRYMQLNVTDS